MYIVFVIYVLNVDMYFVSCENKWIFELVLELQG